MLSWITGSRINDVAELDVSHMDSSIFEPPETPAPIFAVNAFKHALFGTPAPEDTMRKLPAPRRTGSKARFQTLDDRGQKVRPKEHSSPAKPASILMTPGTINGRRKNVTFGSGVVDNEGGKRGQTGKSGIPNDCPGKFPSPYTPKERQSLDIRARTNLTTSLQESKAGISPGLSSQPPQRTKDDADITLDVLEPRSQSGRYWKDTHEAYAAKSEKETRKLIAKRKLAKDFAKKKDAEATELRVKLNSERKKYLGRERDWETSVKDLQERLRKAVAENTRYVAELALLRQQLEANMTRPTTEMEVAARRNQLDVPRTTVNLPELKIEDSQSRVASSSSLDNNQASTTEQQTGKTVTQRSLTNIDLDGARPTLSQTMSSNPRSMSATATTTATSVSQGRGSSKARCISTKPVTVTTAHVRTAQSSSSGPRPTTSQTTTRTQQGLDKPAPTLVSNIEDSEDFWAISDLDSPKHKKVSGPMTSTTGHRSREALKDRSANDAQLPATTASSSDGGSTSNSGNENLQSPHRSTMLKQGERSPRHFPGSPAGSTRPLQSSAASTNTNLPASRMEQARQRLAARKASRKTKEDAQQKENIDAVPSN